MVIRIGFLYGSTAEFKQTKQRFNMDDVDRDEGRISKFNGNEGEDYELWSLRLNAVLEGRDLASVVYGDDCP